MSLKKAKYIAALGLCLALSGCRNTDEVSETKLGLDCVVSQDYQGAINHLEQALISGEDSEEVYRAKGLAYMGSKDYAKAISSFKTALSYAGMIPGELEYDINYYLAVCYYKIGDYKAAISVYDGIIGMKPKDKDAYFLRGTMELYTDNADAAVADFDKAVSLKKNDYGMYIDIYACMKEKGYEEQAEKYLDVVMAVNINDVGDYDKGRLCYYQGNYEQGCNYLERAREAEPANIDAVNMLSECYRETGQYAYAAVVYSTYLSTTPNPEVYNRLGLCYIEQGDYTSALSAFQSGIQIKENNTCLQTLLLNEIACYEYMLDFKTAKEKLGQYMDIYPSDEVIKKEYAFLTTRQS